MPHPDTIFNNINDKIDEFLRPHSNIKKIVKKKDNTFNIELTISNHHTKPPNQQYQPTNRRQSLGQYQPQPKQQQSPQQIIKKPSIPRPSTSTHLLVKKSSRSRSRLSQHQPKQHTKNQNTPAPPKKIKKNDEEDTRELNYICKIEKDQAFPTIKTNSKLQNDDKKKPTNDNQEPILSFKPYFTIEDVDFDNAKAITPRKTICGKFKYIDNDGNIKNLTADSKFNCDLIKDESSTFIRFKIGWELYEGTLFKLLSGVGEEAKLKNKNLCIIMPPYDKSRIWFVPCGNNPDLEIVKFIRIPRDILPGCGVCKDGRQSPEDIKNSFSRFRGYLPEEAKAISHVASVIINEDYDCDTVPCFFCNLKGRVGTEREIIDSELYWSKTIYD